MGDRFRMLVRDVDAVTPPQALPKLRVADMVWSPRLEFKTAAAAWVYTGGPHHTVLSQALSRETLEDFAEMMGWECLAMDEQTRACDPSHTTKAEERGGFQECRSCDVKRGLAV